MIFQIRIWSLLVDFFFWWDKYMIFSKPKVLICRKVWISQTLFQNIFWFPRSVVPKDPKATPAKRPTPASAATKQAAKAKAKATPAAPPDEPEAAPKAATKGAAKAASSKTRPAKRARN